MRITATALVLLAASSTTTVRRNEGDAPAILPAVSAYVPNNAARRPGYGASSSPSSPSASSASPKQNSNGDASSPSAVYYRSTADVYENTDSAYETVQERIHRVRSGHMSEAEKRAYLKSALGGTGNALDQTAATTGTGSSAKKSQAASASATTNNNDQPWSHPSYTPPRYITSGHAEVADSKRRYLESVMDPNRFQGFGNVGRSGVADDGGATAFNTDGMSADEAELAVVQAQIARIEEEKKRVAAEAKEKADIEAARHKLQEQQRIEKEREATAQLNQEKEALAEKEREAIEKATLAERLTAATREASKKLGEETASLAERLAAAAEEAELKRQLEKRDQEEQDRILRAERERLVEAEKSERIELARAAEEHFREQERLEEEQRVAAEQKAQEEKARLEQERLEQERIAAEERAAAEEAQERAELEEVRLEQERLAAEEAAAQEAKLAEEQRLTNEQAEAERLERERIEAEKNAYIERFEAQRLAEEQECIDADQIRDEDLQAIADAQRLEQERIEAEFYASQEENQALAFDYVADDFGTTVDFGTPALPYGEETSFVPTTMEDINIMSYSIVEAMRPLTNPPAQPTTDFAAKEQPFEIPNPVEAASGAFVGDDLSSSLPAFPTDMFSIQVDEFVSQESMQVFDDVVPVRVDQNEYDSFETENALLIEDNVYEDNAEMEAKKPVISLRERFEIYQVEMQRLAEERAADEEEARIQAEKAELERIESERLAVEKAEQDRIEAERLAAEKAEQERIEAERRLAAKRLQALRMVAQVAEKTKTAKMNDRSKMRPVPDPGFFGTPQGGNALFQIPSDNALDEGLDLGREVARALQLADDALAHANDEDLRAERLNPKEQVKRIVETTTDTTSKIAMVAVKGSIFLGGVAAISALQLGSDAAKKAWNSVMSNSKVWERSSLFPTSVDKFDAKRVQAEIGDALKRTKKAWITNPTSVDKFDAKRVQAEIGDALKRTKKAWITNPTSVDKFDAKRVQAEIGDALKRTKKAWITKYGGPGAEE